MGGLAPFPTYQNYTAGDNYSETLRLVYDPAKLSYDTILQNYWQFAPDPTMPEPDPAYQLRIFYVDEAQRKAAQASIDKQPQGTLVELVAAADYTFWKAEEYHQHYFDKSGETCSNQKRLAASRPQL